MGFFLCGRTIQVKIGSHLSEPYKTETGTLQGSVISPTLFLVMFNDIFKELSDSYGKSFSADD